MAKFAVQTEHEADHGWEYQVEVVHDGGEVTEHRVSLAWVDHDHWCGGRLAPSRVVEAVLGYLDARKLLDSLPPKFDAARARRLSPEIDQELRYAL